MAATRAIEHAFSHRTEMHEEFRAQASDGSYRSYATIARPLFDEAGAPQRPRRRDAGCDRSGASRRRNCAAPSSCCVRPPRIPRTRCCWSIRTCAFASSTRPLSGMTIEQIVGARDLCRCCPSRLARRWCEKLRSRLRKRRDRDLRVRVPGRRRDAVLRESRGAGARRRHRHGHFDQRARHHRAQAPRAGDPRCVEPRAAEPSAAICTMAWARSSPASR